MTAYILRRIILGVVTLLAVTCFVFMLSRLMPGDPLLLDMAESDPSRMMNPEDYELAKKAYGLDKNWLEAYFIWLGNLVRLDMGDSIRYRTSVSTLIGSRIGATLLLSVPSFLITYGAAIPLGIYATRRSGKLDERIMSVFFYMLYSIPTYVLALWLLYWFYLQLAGTIWQLPPGMSSINYNEMSLPAKAADLLRHMLLPLFCYTYTSFAYDTRFVKANMEEAVRQDYIRTARAKGLDDRTVLFRHAFRNTLIPFVTIIGLTLPSLISGAVILEQIFEWPGIGKLYYDAVIRQDYTVIMGLTLMFSCATLLGQLIADILYAVVDPRVTYK